MRVRTSAEHRIRQYLETVYLGLDAFVNSTGLYEATVTDASGNKIRMVYEGGQVYETGA